MISVMIVDDHPIVRFGLAGLLDLEPDIEVCAEAASGMEAITVARRCDPDVMLLDLRMPNGDGLEVLAALGLSRTRFVVLTTYDYGPDLDRAIESGAVGYLLKDTPKANLVQTIRAAASGRVVGPGSVRARATEAGARAGAIGRPTEGRSLSARESEVLGLVAVGLTNLEIAGRLFIAESTVKTYLLRIFEKLEVSDRTAATAVAISQGLLDPDGPIHLDRNALLERDER